MGCGVSAEAKQQKHHADQERQATEFIAQEKAVAASEEIELRCTSHEFTLRVRVLQRTGVVLQDAAEAMGMPREAAEWLQMKFADAIVPHCCTLKEAGLRDQAEFGVLDEEQAISNLKERLKAQADAAEAQRKAAEAKRKADKVDIVFAALKGRVGDVQSVLDVYPEKVNAMDEVTSP